MYEDKVLTCKECGREFTFTASEQEFYAEKGFTNEPGRCPECRANRKAQNRTSRGGGAGYGRQERQMFTVVCSECGKETQVPFQPTGDRPVYCQDCYQARRRNSW
ncbi:MAG: zinc-ribbon domain containing protein [Eubacteriales bacterium]